MTIRQKFSVDDQEFAGKRVLVTGGTKGAGEAIVHRLAVAGARVATTARSSDATSPAELFVQADVSTLDSAANVAAATIDGLGGIDIVVHSVGGSKSPGGGFAALSDQIWQDEFNLNLLAAVRLDRLLVPEMIKQGSGAIVHISSIQRACPCTNPPSPIRRQRPRSPPTARHCPRNSAPRASVSTPWRQAGSTPPHRKPWSSGWPLMQDQTKKLPVRVS